MYTRRSMTLEKYHTAQIEIWTVLYIRRFQCVDIVFCHVNVSHVWKRGLRGMFGIVVRAKRACGEGHSIHSMGLVRREVHIHAQRAITQSKGLFISTLIATHVLIICCIYCKYVFVLFAFFPLLVSSH
jgi:hypothetical protein